MRLVALLSRAGRGGTRIAILPGVRFDISHSFEPPPEEVGAVLLDEDYQRSLGDASSFLKARELVSQDEHPDGRVRRRVRCVLGIDLGAAARFIGDGEPAWIEEATWHPKDMRWKWTIVPEVAHELLNASGEIELHADGAGTERVIHGNVKVRVPIYGGKVETVIVRGLEHAYDEEAERLAAWLGAA